jgi:hypothetical protein
MSYYSSTTSFVRERGIAKEDMKEFISAVDDLKEIANDIDSRFFFSW